jgi:hypothetical protein
LDAQLRNDLDQILTESGLEKEDASESLRPLADKYGPEEQGRERKEQEPDQLDIGPEALLAGEVQEMDLDLSQPAATDREYPQETVFPGNSMAVEPQDAQEELRNTTRYGLRQKSRKKVFFDS